MVGIVNELVSNEQSYAVPMTTDDHLVVSRFYKLHRCIERFSKNVMVITAEPNSIITK